MRNVSINMTMVQQQGNVLTCAEDKAVLGSMTNAVSEREGNLEFLLIFSTKKVEKAVTEDQ